MSDANREAFEAMQKALWSIVSEPDRNLDQRPERMTAAKAALSLAARQSAPPCSHARTGPTEDHRFECLDCGVKASAPSQAPAPKGHPDDLAVDRFAVAMKEKLAIARSRGRGGWERPIWDGGCSQLDLSIMLREHVEKGDPVDVANFCMFLHQRSEGIALVPWAVDSAELNKNV
jgi:hypothetical protein